MKNRELFIIMTITLLFSSVSVAGDFADLIDVSPAGGEEPHFLCVASNNSGGWEKTDDVVWAIETLLGYAEPPVTTHSVYLTPAGELRRQADAIERRERDIERVLEILAALKGGVG